MLHNTNDSSIISEVIYNHELDVFQVLLFGSPMTMYADETTAQEHSMTLRHAYSSGRKDVVYLLDNGKVTLEQLVKTELELDLMKKHPNPLSLPKGFSSGQTVELIPEDFMPLKQDYTEDDIF